MKNQPSSSSQNRRQFLKTGALSGAAALAGLGSMQAETPAVSDQSIKSKISDEGELLYNGIQLPAEWPPRTQEPAHYDPMPIPYLASPPDIIPIDVGRQLFVDDFLIEKTDLSRNFHQPEKYEGNPLLKPETEVEMNKGYCPMAAPFSDGCFYDPKDKLFKMWYMAGWFDGTALATSKDGIHWERPAFDVVPGTNLVLPPGESRDGVSVWIDHEAKDPNERYKMYRFERKGKVGEKLSGGAGYIMTSPDGIHWTWHGQVGKTGDNSTFFYNPFRKKWVFTIRAFGRPAPPWTYQAWDQRPRGRARSYWEHADFKAAVGSWKDFDPVFWLGTDRLDGKREGYDIGREPQLYKVDAAGYESLMIGFLQPHYGPPNTVCAKGGFPKLTELQLAFSRDGFHWDRSNRETFIGATLDENNWDRAYVHSIGGVCNIVEDKLHFYYTAFQGDASNLHDLQYWSGMYAHASTGLATLRRDGFASMGAGSEEGILLTKKLTFSGAYLFVNVDGQYGELRVEVCQEDGKPIPGFGLESCIPISVDSTKHMIRWTAHDSLETLAGQTVRFRFYLKNVHFYAFWVSSEQTGKSGGAIAAGGPGLSGNWDV
ncbi:MAG: twin-arginine translocation signal domain-containing protein [Bacteroidota bacterium]